MKKIFIHLVRSKFCFWCRYSSSILVLDIWIRIGYFDLKSRTTTSCNSQQNTITEYDMSLSYIYISKHFGPNFDLVHMRVTLFINFICTKELGMGRAAIICLRLFTSTRFGQIACMGFKNYSFWVLLIFFFVLWGVPLSYPMFDKAWDDLSMALGSWCFNFGK